MPSETTLCPKCGNAMRPVLDRKGGFTCTSLRCTGYGVRQPVSAAPRREPTPGRCQPLDDNCAQAGTTPTCPECGSTDTDTLHYPGGRPHPTLRWCHGGAHTYPVPSGTTQREEWVVQEQSTRPSDPKVWTDFVREEDRTEAEDAYRYQRKYYSTPARSLRFRLVHRVITETVIEGASE